VVYGTSPPFRPGDVQFLNNYVTLHTRRAYEDWPEPSRKRHLLRLWLSDPESHPKGQREESFRRGGISNIALVLPAPRANSRRPNNRLSKMRCTHACLAFYDNTAHELA
jgi:hypothetical protein